MSYISTLLDSNVIFNVIFNVSYRLQRLRWNHRYKTYIIVTSTGRLFLNINFLNVNESFHLYVDLFVSLLPTFTVLDCGCLLRSRNCRASASLCVHSGIVLWSVLLILLVFCFLFCFACLSFVFCCPCLCIFHSWFNLRFSLTFGFTTRNFTFGSSHHINIYASYWNHVKTKINNYQVIRNI